MPEKSMMLESMLNFAYDAAPLEITLRHFFVNVANRGPERITTKFTRRFSSVNTVNIVRFEKRLLTIMARFASVVVNRSHCFLILTTIMAIEKNVRLKVNHTAEGLFIVGFANTTGLMDFRSFAAIVTKGVGEIMASVLIKPNYHPIGLAKSDQAS